MSEEALGTGWFASLLAWSGRRFEQPAEPPVAAAEDGLVVAYHPRARAIGLRILEQGGNAADAFVATVVAENVLAEGVSSLGGPLGVLVHWAAPGGTHSAHWLDADFDQPFDPAQADAAAARPAGLAVLVPGAPMGLHELANRYATLPLATLIEPAAELAEEGFPVNRLMAGLLHWRRSVLGRSEYGRHTFFRDGRPLRAGETLRQPEVASLLRRWAAEGPNLWYRGHWTERFLNAVREAGGRLTAADLAAYRARWREPLGVAYRDHTVLAAPAPSFGGLWVLLALKVWERAAAEPGAAARDDAETLELMIRTAHHVWAEPGLLDAAALADGERVHDWLGDAHADALWQRVRRRERARPMTGTGSHSYQVIARDAAGSVVSGTTTIVSAPWGEGIFVAGVPLSGAGAIPWAARPGQRRLTPVTSQLVLRDGAVRFAVGTISNSLLEAAYQIVVNLLDRGMPLEAAITAPRFGTFPPRRWWRRQLPSLDRNWLDPRVGGAVVRQLRRRGLRVVQSGSVDTGLGAVLAETDTGPVGMTLPIPYLDRPFEDPAGAGSEPAAAQPQAGGADLDDGAVPRDDRPAGRDGPRPDR